MSSKNALAYAEREKAPPVKDKMIFARVPVRLAEEASLIAEEYGLNFSEFLRAAIQKFSDELKTEPKGSSTKEPFKLKQMNFDLNLTKSHWK